MVWRVTTSALMFLQRSAYCRCAASNCCPGLMSSQYVISIKCTCRWSTYQTCTEAPCPLCAICARTDLHPSATENKNIYRNPGALEPALPGTHQTHTSFLSYALVRENHNYRANVSPFPNSK
eukprot:963659-Pelagomonas_calceolata.AAC.1